MIAHQRFFAELQTDWAIKMICCTANASVKVLTTVWIGKEAVVCRITGKLLFWTNERCRRRGCCRYWPIGKTVGTFG